MLINAKWAIFQLYHGKNKLHFHGMMTSTLDQTKTKMMNWTFYSETTVYG